MTGNRVRQNNYNNMKNKECSESLASLLAQYTLYIVYTQLSINLDYILIAFSSLHTRSIGSESVSMVLPFVVGGRWNWKGHKSDRVICKIMRLPVQVPSVPVPNPHTQRRAARGRISIYGNYGMHAEKGNAASDFGKSNFPV